jgi:transcriptional regulator with XRE-family HTH domain
MDFSEKIVSELNTRGWSRSEAARRGGISPSMFDKVINGHSEPGIKFLKGIAKAFSIPFLEVASWVDATSKTPDSIDVKILNETKDMTEQEKNSLLAFIRSTKQMRAPEPERGSMPASNLSKVKK